MRQLVMCTKIVCTAAIALLPLTAACAQTKPPTARLWDTVVPLQERTPLAASQKWSPVTPATANHLKGDLVVQTRGMSVGFASRLGKVIVSSNAGPVPERARAEVRPAELAGKPATLASTRVAEQGGTIVVQADFAARGAKRLPIAFSFADDRILTITPQGNTGGLGLAAPMDLAMVPSFLGEDLIYDARNYPSAETLSIPSEHFLVGLLEGQRHLLVMTWQEAIPTVRLSVSSGGQPGLGAVSFVGGKALSLAFLDAPGIWHREILKPAMLERDVPIAWKPPFPARWLTQLLEDDVKTTFEFRDHKENTWRGAVGFYDYPTWFSQGKTMLTLGKKIPPQGDAIIYCLERTDATPPQVLTPIDVVQRTLTGDVLAGILMTKEREAWFPERPNAVIGAATCATTDALKAIFDAGQEVEKQDLVKGGVEDMYFYLEHMQERNARFPAFAKDLLAYLDGQRKADPKQAPYLDEMTGTAQEIVTTYDEARDTIRDMKYAHELGDKTIALAAKKRPDNPQRMMDLKQDWTGMGGALEHLACREHTLTRKLYQQAAYRAATSPGVIPIAEEIRRRAKHCLENPESYEIWANY